MSIISNSKRILFVFSGENKFAFCRKKVIKIKNRDKNEENRLFEAVISAGGKGTRLFPLTQNLPKPAVKVAGEPVFSRIVRSLEKIGIKNIAVTALYKAQTLKDALEDFKGLNIEIFEEEKPLGSAGGVANLIEKLAKTVIILPGDGVFDFDLSAAIISHKKTNAALTMLLSEAKDPTEYGCVFSKDGIAKRFFEKPSWSEAFSPFVNTGIYICEREVLKLIPKGKFFDFSRDLFPLLMRKNIKIHTFNAEGYWRDIGNPADFILANLDKNGNRSYIAPTAEISKDAKVSRSVIFDNVKISKGASVDFSLVCEGCTIGENAVLKCGCAVGEGCTVEKDACIEAGVKIGANIKIEKGRKIMKNIISPDEKQRLFDEAGFIDKNILLSEAAKLAFVLAGDGGGSVFLMHGKSPRAFALYNLISRAVCACGCRSAEGGEGFFSLFCFGCRFLSPKFGVFAADDGIYITDSNSNPVSAQTERELEKAFFSAESLPSLTPKEPLLIGDRIKNAYFRKLLVLSSGLRRDFFPSSKNAPSDWLRAALIRRPNRLFPDFSPGDGTEYYLGDDGRAESLIIRSGGKIYTYMHAAAYIVKVKIFSGAQKQKLSFNCPKLLKDYFLSLGIKEENLVFKSRRGEKGSADERLDLFLTDGCFCLLEFFAALEQTGENPRAALEALPPFLLRNREIEIDKDKKAALIGRLCDRFELTEGGIVCGNDKGEVKISPLYKNAFRLTACASSFEASEELFRFVTDAVSKE